MKHLSSAFCIVFRILLYYFSFSFFFVSFVFLSLSRLFFFLFLFFVTNSLTSSFFYCLLSFLFFFFIFNVHTSFFSVSLTFCFYFSHLLTFSLYWIVSYLRFSFFLPPCLLSFPHYFLLLIYPSVIFIFFLELLWKCRCVINIYIVTYLIDVIFNISTFCVIIWFTHQEVYICIVAFFFFFSYWKKNSMLSNIKMRVLENWSWLVKLPSYEQITWIFILYWT